MLNQKTKRVVDAEIRYVITRELAKTDETFRPALVLTETALKAYWGEWMLLLKGLDPSWVVSTLANVAGEYLYDATQEISEAWGGKYGVVVDRILADYVSTFSIPNLLCLRTVMSTRLMEPSTLSQALTQNEEQFASNPRMGPPIGGQ